MPPFDTLTPHALCLLFPPMGDEEFAGLKADIQRNGLRDRILLTHDAQQILDGRHRHRACMELHAEGERGPMDDYDFEMCEEDDDLLGKVLSLNFHRRHLSTGQRAMVAARLSNLEKGQRADLAQEQDRQICLSSPVTQKQAAELISVGERSVKKARVVLSKGCDELVAAVERNEISIDRAASYATFSHESQRELLSGEKLPEELEHKKERPMPKPKPSRSAASPKPDNRPIHPLGEDFDDCDEDEGAEVSSEAPTVVSLSVFDAKDQETISQIQDAEIAKIAEREAKEEYYTPDYILEVARRVSGEIDLDPTSCEMANELVQAKHYFTREDDALAQDWQATNPRTVWCNFPYTPGVMGPLVEHHLDWAQQSDTLKHMYCLTNVMGSSSWWQYLCAEYDAVCFLQKRTAFLMPDGTYREGNWYSQSLFYWGPDVDRFALFCKGLELGYVTRLGL